MVLHVVLERGHCGDVVEEVGFGLRGVKNFLEVLARTSMGLTHSLHGLDNFGGEIILGVLRCDAPLARLPKPIDCSIALPPPKSMSLAWQSWRAELSGI